MEFSLGPVRLRSLRGVVQQTLNTGNVPQEKRLYLFIPRCNLWQQPGVPSATTIENKNTKTQKHKHTHTNTHKYHRSLNTPWKDQCERHRMTRMTGPDCAVMYNLINTHRHTHTYTHIISTDRRWCLRAPDSSVRKVRCLYTRTATRG